MKGKEKCRALKEIRRQIAEKNDIPYAVSRCSHQGDCKGTCPKCEAELQYLERELAVRKNLGKVVAIAGISVGACSSLTACSPTETAQNAAIPAPMSLPVGEVLVGTVPLETPEATEAEWQLLLPNPGDFPPIPVPSPSAEDGYPVSPLDIEGLLEIAPETVPEPITGEIIEGEDEIMTLELVGDIAMPEDGSFE